MRVESHISLRILHESLSPDQVSALMGMRADRFHTKGDPVRKGSSTTHQRGYWGIDSGRHMLMTEPLDHHICWLLDKIEHSRAQVVIWQSLGWQIDLCIGAFTESGHGGPEMSSAVLERLGRLGLTVYFDLYPAAFDEPDL